MALANASKGTSSVTEYITKMNILAEEMASAGKKLEDDKMVSYILNGLDDAFDSVVSAIVARVEPISVAELFTQLTCHEQCIEMRNGQQAPSANMVNKSGGRSGGSSNNSRGRGGGGRGGFGRGFQKGGRNGGGRGPGFLHGVYCQMCGKEGHMALKCFKRFDASYTGPPQKSASFAMTSYGVDTYWYVDSGAIDHVTSELKKLTVPDKYDSHEQVHSASGTGAGHEEDSPQRQM